MPQRFSGEMLNLWGEFEKQRAEAFSTRLEQDEPARTVIDALTRENEFLKLRVRALSKHILANGLPLPEE